MAQAYLTAYQELYDALGLETLCAGRSSVYLPLVLSPPAAPANVQITAILYNPDGDDVDGEYVEIQNKGETAEHMNNWTLRDDSPHVFMFPPFTLDPGGMVRVWTKSGADTDTDLYWGRGSAVWNNSGDVATLRDAHGQTIDVCDYYPGGGTSATCE